MDKQIVTDIIKELELTYFSFQYKIYGSHEREVSSYKILDYLKQYNFNPKDKKEILDALKEKLRHGV